MKNFKFYKLIKNKEINNEKLTLEELQAKFTEEATEVIEALVFYKNEPSFRNCKALITELFDVIQMVITILCKLKSKDENYNNCLSEAYNYHSDKLVEREWEKGEVIGVLYNE